MARHGVVPLALFAATAFTGAIPQGALAQGPASGPPAGFNSPGPGFGPATIEDQPDHSSDWNLLMQPDVVSELKLSDQEQKAVSDLYDRGRKEMQARLRETIRTRDPAPSFGPGETRAGARSAQIREMRGQMMDSFAVGLNGCLRPEQLSRLQSLDLQWRGPLAMSDPAVAKLLNLTTAQQGRVAQILAQCRSAADRVASAGVQQTPLPGNADPAEALQPTTFDELLRRRAVAEKEAQAVRKQATASLISLLTPEQKTRWTQLLGKPFRFAGSA